MSGKPKGSKARARANKENSKGADVYAKATCEGRDRSLILRYLGTRGLKIDDARAETLWAAGLRVWRWKPKEGAAHPAPGSER